MISSSPDVEADPLQQQQQQPLPCPLPPQPDLCYAPQPPHELVVNPHVLYSGPFSSPSDSMLSESDLDSFQNRTDSPRSASSTSSPHSNHNNSNSNAKPASALLGRSNNSYKSVITTSHLDFNRLKPQQQFQRNFDYNDACYFESRQQQPMDKGYCEGGGGEFAPPGVQPQYTSVIVDAQQYQMANGFVH